MLRASLRLVHRLSPGLARVLHETWYTLSGWRFDDVKRHVDDRLARLPANQAAFAHSIATLREPPLRAPRIAYISNLPPETTGIATCSFHSLLGAHEPIDVFCPVTEADWFFANDLQLRRAGPDGPRLLDVQAFLTADRLQAYRAIVIAVGNSDHCGYIPGLLRKAEALDGGLRRVVFHVHDPFVLNLIEKGSGLSSAELVTALTAGEQRQALQAAAPGDVHGTLARAGVSGMRWFANLGVRRFLTNSRAATAILAAELAGMDAEIGTLFHPVFLPAGIAPDHGEPGCLVGDRLTVGSFGYPGADKSTERVIDAVRALHAGGHPVRLLLAGYGVARYAAAHAEALAGLDVELLDGPADRQLCRAMQAVDIAVQLRAENRGESSGTVAQLIALGRRILVADIGAFGEYGPAVHTIAARPTAKALAASILEVAGQPPARAAMRAYADAHSPERFRAALLAAVAASPKPTPLRALIPAD